MGYELLEKDSLITLHIVLQRYLEHESNIENTQHKKNVKYELGRIEEAME